MGRKTENEFGSKVIFNAKFQKPVAQNDKSTNELMVEQTILRHAALFAPLTSFKDKGDGEMFLKSIDMAIIRCENATKGNSRGPFLKIIKRRGKGRLFLK
jgi:hypothetical protein